MILSNRGGTLLYLPLYFGLSEISEAGFSCLMRFSDSGTLLYSNFPIPKQEVYEEKIMPLHFIRLHSSLLFLLTSATVSCLCSDAAHAQEAATAPRYRAFALRLGGNIGSTLGPMVGLDFTVPQWSIGRGFVTRFTLESVFNSRRGSLQSTVQPIFFMTVDQVYSKPGANWQHHLRRHL